MSEPLNIRVESSTVEANDWVEAGEWHSAMWWPQPEGLRGCPSGRSQVSREDAVRDLLQRTNDESGTSYTFDQVTVLP